MRRTAAVVLAGGTSRRMGRDKRLLRLLPGSPTLLERTVAVGRAVADRVAVVGGPADDGLRWTHVPDERPGEGPLAALAVALGRFAGDRLVVLACDYPMLQVALLRRLLAAGDDADAVVAVDAVGRQHPLVAVYDGRAVAPVVASLIDGGERSMAALLAHLDAAEVPAEGMADGLSLRNANTPEELARLRSDALEVDRRARTGTVR